MAPAPPRPRRRRVLFEWAAVAAAATAVVAVLSLGQLAARADAVIYDAFSKLGVRTPRDDIVIVAIDNRSIQALGRWPWPRARHAELLRRLAQARPKAVAYDVLFVDPDRDPGADLALAEAVKAARPTLLPLTFDVPGENGAPFRTALPAPPLREAAAGLGQVNIAFDPDGVVRRAFLSEGDAGHDWPHLMELTYRQARGAPSPAFGPAPPPSAPHALDGLARRRPMMIAFTGPAGRFRTISFVDMIQGDVPAVFLRDKLVLVGATADGLGDRYATPLSGEAEAMPGVEVQANMLDGMLSGHAIRPLGPIGALGFALAPLWLLLASFLRLRPRENMLLGAGLIVAVLAVSAGLLLHGGLWAPPAAGLIGLLAVYPLWSWRRLEATSAYMVEELDAFAGEPDLLPDLAEAARRPGGEVIDHQLDLMRRTIGRARNLRHFVTDVLQGLPDATLVLAPDERVLAANREAEALFGGTDGRGLAGARLADLIAPFARAEGEGEGDAAAPDVEAAAPDGRVFSTRRQPLTDAAGRAAGWIVRFTDISAIKAAGRQRENILQLLTHDMRSPQVSILALLDSRDGAAAPDELAGRIRGYARRTLALADNFVHMARAETQHYAMETVDLGDLLLDAADDLWPQSSAKGVAVEVSTGDAEHLIRADRSLLTRALINLIDNGVKYTDAGGRVECRVAAGGTIDRPTAVCTIADTGRGMSPEQAEKLFERFHRAPSAGRTRADGVGLGLVFVQTVIERHDGDIRCESRLGEGSTFTITLPLETDGGPGSPISG